MRHSTPFIYLVLVPICLLTSKASAQAPTLPAVPPGEDKITYLSQGASAPYSGQLFDNPTAMRWGNWLKQWKLRYEINMQEQARLCTNNKSLYQMKLELEQEKYNRMVATYQLEVGRLNTIISTPAPWYKTPWFYASIGVVGTLVLTGVAVYEVNSFK